MRFARLFDFEAGQLLLCITINDDLNGFLLSVETFHQCAFIKTGLAFTKLEEAIESLEGFSEQQAEELYQSLTKAISEPPRIMTSGIVEGFEAWLKDSKN